MPQNEQPKKATQETLASLHNLVASKLIELLNEDPSPQRLAQAIKFLKDNGIECDISSSQDGKQMEELIKLAEGVPQEEPDVYQFDGLEGRLSG